LEAALAQATARIASLIDAGLERPVSRRSSRVARALLTGQELPLDKPAT